MKKHCNAPRQNATIRFSSDFKGWIIEGITFHGTTPVFDTAEEARNVCILIPGCHPSIDLSTKSENDQDCLIQCMRLMGHI